MSLGLSVLNVNAATCGTNETEHTNYYLFLDALAPTYIRSEINASSSNNYIHRTGAYMANTINGNRIIEHGNVNVTNGSDNTTTRATTTWNMTQFWQRYSNAIQNKNSRFYYDADANTSYFLHDGWDAYASNDSNYSSPHSKDPDSNNKARNTALNNYLLRNYSNIASSELVTKSTSLPTTRIDTDISGIQTSTDTQVYFKLMRTYISEDLVDGSNLGGTVDGTQIRAYGPAVYYIKYCVKGDGDEEKVLIYDKNDGTGEITRDTFTGSTTTVRRNVNPTRTGYTFKGWSNNSGSGNNIDYAPGDTYTATGNQTEYRIYAVWEANEPVTNKVLIYDKNDGTGEITRDTFTGSTTTVRRNVNPTRTGYTFKGWSNNSGSGNNIDYAPGDTYTATGNQTEYRIYAVWEANAPVTKVHIRYNPNDPNPSQNPVTNMPNDDEFDSGTCARIGTAPSKIGYTFLGWSTTSNGTVAYTGGEQYCGTDDLTLYAIWRQNVADTYYVRYHANLPYGVPESSLSNMPSNVENIDINQPTIIAYGPSLTGYTFLGWSLDPNATQPDANYAPTREYRGGIGKNLDLHAIWRKNSTPAPVPNPTTGVESYLLPAGGAVSLAGIGLGILKKKKGYLQF